MNDPLNFMQQYFKDLEEARIQQIKEMEEKKIEYFKQVSIHSIQ